MTWRPTAVVSFAVTAESGRRYRDHDLELATDVGRRAGFAIDHALLYQAAERKIGDQRGQRRDANEASPVAT